jgi:L-asparaginase II
MESCLAHPEMIAGNDRTCTRVMRAAPGKCLAKTGTEGSYAAALPGLRNWGWPSRWRTGTTAPWAPVLCQALHSLGVLGHDLLDGPLADLYQPKLKNHRKRGGCPAWGRYSTYKARLYSAAIKKLTG